jgi:hypothetical protein
MKSFVDQEKLMACLIRNVKGILQWNGSMLSSNVKT